MRILTLAASSFVALLFWGSASAQVESPSEQCFPWSASFQQGEKAKLNIVTELCYEVPKDDSGVQKIWGSSLSTEAQADGQAFGNKLQLGKWNGGIKISSEGVATARGEVIVAGQEVLNKSYVVEDVAIGRNLQLIGFEQNVARRFMIGVVPVTVSIGILTDGHVDMEAAVMKSNIGFDVSPNLNSNAYAKAGFGNQVVFFGFSGGVELVNEQLAMAAVIHAPKKGEKVKLKVMGKNYVKALTGAIDATIKVNGNKFVQNISSFEGMERSDTLFDRVIDVN